MPAEHNPGLWNQVLDRLQQVIDPHSFDTWFRPIAFAGADDTRWELTVPNDIFQAHLRDNYSIRIDAAIREVLGSSRQLFISIRPPDSGSPPLPPTLPVLQASQLESAPGQNSWLIDSLWMNHAVGILGGPPRAYKTWLALDIAVSVASGSPCLGVFPVARPGPVLLYAAEDSLYSLRSRLASISRVRQIDFDHLDVHVITADRLRLDQPDDQQRFSATVTLLRPILVILDPLVRIHSADENASTAVAALLGYFRALQRATGAAILLTHHSRKNQSDASGHSLRGSSDFYAWTDCLLYLERRQDQHRLLVEHRAAAGSGPFPLQLVTSSDHGPYLKLLPNTDSTDPPSDSLQQSILNLLGLSSQPLPAETLRVRLGVRKQRLLETLRTLSTQGHVARLQNGFVLKRSDS